MRTQVYKCRGCAGVFGNEVVGIAPGEGCTFTVTFHDKVLDVRDKTCPIYACRCEWALIDEYEYKE